MEQKSLVVEYLIIMKQDSTFCENEKAFIKFISVDSRINITEKDKLLNFSLKKGVFSVSYNLVSDLVPLKDERYFKFSLVSKEINKIKEFDELTGLLYNVFSKLHSNVSINVLWNDIARNYAIEGYTLINEVENLLRRLITNFMLTKVGFDFPKYYIPNEVADRDAHLKSNYSDYLHQTYFGDLKTILFEGQRDFNLRNIGDIQRKVEKYISDKKKEISIEELKGIVSKSLWEKHFSKDSSYKKTDLENDLEALNTLRNEIAHNRHISRETLGKIQSLSKKIIKTLKLEIEDLPNKTLTPNEQRFQSEIENTRIAEINPMHFGFLAESIVKKWYENNFNIESIHETQFDSGVDLVFIQEIDKRIGVQIKATNLIGLRQIRNQIAHGVNLEKFFPQSFDEYYEFNLVIVLRDYNPSYDLSFAIELGRFIKGINPKVKLIVGFINENNEFITLIQ